MVPSFSKVHNAQGPTAPSQRGSVGLPESPKVQAPPPGGLHHIMGVTLGVTLNVALQCGMPAFPGKRNLPRKGTLPH